MTAPARSQRAARAKKPAPPAPTAHVGYQPAGRDLSGRSVRERYHAMADQPVKTGFVTRYPGEALCGATGPWADSPDDALFGPLVTCPWCRQIAATEHVTIIEGDT